jgi:filamentous hemagglutinin family protein
MQPNRTIARITLFAFVCSLPGTPLSAELVGVENVHGVEGVTRDASLTTIHTRTERSIFDAERLDVLQHETLRIEQPSARSKTLARVTGDDPSELVGTVQAPGSFYLANPNGVFLGGQLVLDVAQFVATTGSISNADFLEGRDRFTSLAGPIVNSGQVNARGDVVLLGRTVANHGSITAPAGTVAYVAGESVVLSQLGGHLQITVEPVLQSDGGSGAGSGGGLSSGDYHSLAINHRGITRATEIHAEGGDGVVRVAGTLDASARGAGERGGRITVTGELVSLEGATLDASGTEGGGEIRVGGDWRGVDGVRQARRTVVDAASTLRADALERGDGADVVVWSAESTGFFGAISARGAGADGNGGDAEISGHSLVARGSVDLGAESGARGTLLYDPQEIRIRGGSADGSDSVDPASDPDLLTGTTTTDSTTNIRTTRILFDDTGTEPFDIFESEIEGTDANIVLEARHRIEATGSFTNDADGLGLLDDGETLLIKNGRNLTLRTRNNTGDEAGVTNANAGIDLRGNGSLTIRTTGGGRIVLATGDDGAGGGGTANSDAAIQVAHLRSEGSNVTLSTKQGSIAATSIDTRGSSGDDRDGGNVTLSAGTRSTTAIPVTAGIAVSAGIDTRGADEVSARGGNGGRITLTSSGSGNLSVGGAIDTRGGAGTSDGGAGGSVDLEAAGGNLNVSTIDSSGGNASAGTGGAAGAVELEIRSADDLVIGDELRAVGGDGSQNGGAAGQIQLKRANGTLELQGELTSLAGDGGAQDGRSSSVSILGAGTLVLPTSGDVIHSDGDVTLQGASLGSAALPVRIDANGSVDSKLSIHVNGDAAVEVTRKGFSAIDVAQSNPNGDISITQEGGDSVTGTGVDADTHQLAADTRANSVDLAYRVGNPGPVSSPPGFSTTAADLVIPIDGVKLGGDGFFEATRDIVLGSGSVGGTAIELSAGKELTLNADADTDANDRGNVRDGVSGSAAGEIATNGATSQVLISAGDGIGSAAEPVTLRGGALLSAITETGELAIANQGAGDLTLRDLAHAHPVQTRTLRPGNTGFAAQIQKSANAGNLAITNAGGGIRLEDQLQTPLANAASDITLRAASGSAITLAVPRNSQGQIRVTAEAGGDLLLDGNVVVEAGRDALVSSRGGNLELTGSLDASTSGGASFSGVAPLGSVRYGDGVGSDRIGAQNALSELNTELSPAAGGITEYRVSSVATTGLLRSPGTTRILASETHFDSSGDEVRFDGAVDGPGALVVDRANNVLFGGDVGVTEALSRLEVNVASGTTEFRAPRVVVDQGDIELNPDGRASVPARSTIFRRGGDLSFETPGSFRMGSHEKLTVAGELEIDAARAELGDLNALSIAVDSPEITLLSRAGGSSALPGGASAGDAGLDWVAKRIRLASQPQISGPNPSARFYTEAGEVSPQPIAGVEQHLIDAQGNSLRASSFDASAGGALLDLTGNGPAPFDDPSGQLQMSPPPAPFGAAPQFSEEAPAAATGVSSDALLTALRAPLEGLPSGGELPASIAARAADAAETYRVLFGDSAEALADLRAFRNAVIASGDRSGLGLRRAVDSASESAGARRYLSLLGSLLAQLRLIGATPETLAEVRQHVLERAVDALDVGGLDAGALGSAADPESPGFRL